MAEKSDGVTNYLSSLVLLLDPVDPLVSWLGRILPWFQCTFFLCNQLVFCVKNKQKSLSCLICLMCEFLDFKGFYNLGGGNVKKPP